MNYGVLNINYRLNTGEIFYFFQPKKYSGVYILMLKIYPKPPFDFELNNKLLSDGDPQIKRYENGCYWQVAYLNQKSMLIKVRSSGTVDKPVLVVSIRSDVELDNHDKVSAEKFVRSIYNLDFDLENFYADMENDGVISQLTGKLRGLNGSTIPSLFEALVSSIIEQQISLKAAHSIENRMIKGYGNRLDIDGKTYYGFPTPQILGKLSSESLRKCGLSFRKAKYVINLSQLIEKGELNLESCKSMGTRDIIGELLKIRGIGVWTAEMGVLRGLRRLDTLPVDDIGLRRVVSHYYNDDKPISAEVFEDIARGWGKWKGLAVYYLIVANLLSINIV